VNILDWIIVLLLVGGAISGLRRGLVRSLVGLGGLLLGSVLASRFCGPLCAYLETQFSLVSRLAASLGPHLPLAATVASTPAGQGTAIVDAIRGLGLPPFVTDYLASAAQNLTAFPAGVTVGQALSGQVAAAILGVLCFVGVFVAVQIAAAIAARLIGGVLAVTPLHFVDHLVGAALGAAWAGVFIIVTIGVLGLLTSIPAFAFAQSALQGSTFAPVLMSWFEHLMPGASEWLGKL
jgi:uncharacterized membrane protein required for colicin V production